MMKQRALTAPPARYESFPVDALPEPCRQFIDEAAAAIGCDASYVGVPMLAALAGCIGNSAAVQLKPGWQEPSVIWGAVIGESGTTKSPALDAVTKPIHSAQFQMVRDHQQEMAEYEQAKAAHQAQVNDWKNNGSKEGKPKPEEPTEPTCQRIIVSNSTVEALTVILEENPRGVLLSRDELAGMLLSLNQYKGGKGSDVQDYLTMHGARPLVYDRKGSSKAERKTIMIPRAAVSICGTVQPAILRQALGTEHFQDGLAARFLLAAPPPRAKRWTDAELSDGMQNSLAELYRRLLAVPCNWDKHGEPMPHVLTLTPSGKSLFVKFYNEHAAKQADLQGDLAAAFSKLEGYAARLALVIHMVRQAWFDTSLEDHGAIDGDSIEAGVVLSRWFAGEAERTYGLFGETDEERGQRELVEWIVKHGGHVTARDLQRGPRQYREAGVADQALSDLVKAGYGHWHTITDTGGRPASTFVLAGGDGDGTHENNGRNTTCVAQGKNGVGDGTAVIPAKTALVSPSPPSEEEIADFHRAIAAEQNGTPKLADLDDINARLAEAAEDDAA